MTSLRTAIYLGGLVSGAALVSNGCATSTDTAVGANRGTGASSIGGVATGGMSTGGTTTGGTATGGSATGGTTGGSGGAATGGNAGNATGGAATGGAATGGAATGGAGGAPIKCDSGKVLCDTTCVDESNTNCGSCGHACPAQSSCTQGACVCADSTLTACDSGCVDLTSDLNNCGKCGSACPADAACTASACVCNDTALKFCGSACVNTSTDATHCGSCANDCGANAQCAAGVCGCTGSAKNCGSGSTTLCTNTDTDAKNCGACGHDCGGTATCSAGACHCPTGYDDCGNGCVDLQESALSCGSCTKKCDVSVPYCNAGTCEATPCKVYTALNANTQGAMTAAYTCYRVTGSIGGGTCWNNTGCRIWVNGKAITDCTSNRMGSAQALTDGIDTKGGVYVEVDGCSNASAGFTTWP